MAERQGAAADEIEETARRGDEDVGAAFKLKLLQEGNSALSYTGIWKTADATTASGGHQKYTDGNGARVAFDFTGDKFAWVGVRSSGTGSAKMTVDGTATTVDTHSATSSQATVVAAAPTPSAGSHHVVIKNLATAGHPRIKLDAIVVRTIVGS